MEGPGNWDSGPGVVDVSVISANRALSPNTVDCQCPRKVSWVHNRGKVLLPWVTGSLSSPLHSSPVWQWESKVSAFAECSSTAFRPLRTWLPVCLCAWVRGRQTERQGDNLCVCVRVYVCVRESDGVYSGAVWMVSADLYWMGSNRLLCLYTKKLFCFERNNWAFHRKPESTDNLAAALKDAHTHTQLHPYAWASVCHLCLIQRWDRRHCLCLFCYGSFQCCQVWNWRLMFFFLFLSRYSSSFGHKSLY